MEEEIRDSPQIEQIQNDANTVLDDFVPFIRELTDAVTNILGGGTGTAQPNLRAQGWRLVTMLC